MRKITWLLFVSIVGLAQAQTSPNGQQRPAQKNVRSDQTLNNAGFNAKADDDASIHTLVDSVFNYPHVYPHLPTNTEAAVKDRLFRAEKDYLQKRGPGVQEQGVVDAVNMLADKISAPDYAKTSPLQVRFVRMNLALNTPAFMAKGITRPGAKIGDSINSEMSPTQAFHLMAVTIDQKFINTDFQKTPDEWDQDFRKHLHDPQHYSGVPHSTVALRENAKRRELDGFFGSGLAPINDADNADLMNQVFGKLGLR